MSAPRKEQSTGGSRVELKCEICGGSFLVKRYRALTARFCSQICGGSWHAKTRLAHADKPHMRGNKLRKGIPPSNAFEPGHTPWNRALKGIRLSPGSEFKHGMKGQNWLPVGSETVRDDKTGKSRAFVKLAEPDVWKHRAVVVWERENGRAVRVGCVVHHRDRNSLNDAPANLQEMTRAEHIEEHRSEFPTRPKSTNSAPKQEAFI